MRHRRPHRRIVARLTWLGRHVPARRLSVSVKPAARKTPSFRVGGAPSVMVPLAAVAPPPAGSLQDRLPQRADRPGGVLAPSGPGASAPPFGDHKSGSRSLGTDTRVFERAARSGARRRPGVGSAQRRRSGTADKGALQRSGPWLGSSRLPLSRINVARDRPARLDLPASHEGPRSARVSPPLKTG